MKSYRYGDIWKPANKIAMKKIKPYWNDPNLSDQLRTEMLSQTNETDNDKIIEFLFEEAQRLVNQSVESFLEIVQSRRHFYKDDGSYEREMKELKIRLSSISWTLAKELIKPFKVKKESATKRTISNEDWSDSDDDYDDWICSIQ